MEDNLILGLKNRAAEFKNAQSLSTSKTYLQAAGSINRFLVSKGMKPDVMPFAMLTVKFLQDYEYWMYTHGRYYGLESDGPASVTTLSMYLRCVRCVANIAMEDGSIKKWSYPFGRRKYIIPNGKGDRKPRQMSDIHALLDYSSPEELKQRSRDMWLFSYLCNGMSFCDLLHLRWRNFDFQTRTFTYDRIKTKFTNRKGKNAIHGFIHDECVVILDRWSNKSTNLTKKDAFVFPWINERMSVERRYKVIRAFINETNRKMAEIGKEIGLEGDLGTYIARHSFANTLMQNETPLAFISASLGHSSITATEHYLGRFADIKTNEYLSKLIADRPNEMQKYLDIQFG